MAAAVPAFSRQVGMPCSACHTSFPQLTALGRSFKASAYPLTATEQLSDKRGERVSLDLARFAPVAAQLIASFTNIRSQAALAPGPGVRSGDALLPDQLGLFYAGRIAPDVGAFAQLTYTSADDHFSMDNVDLRYARSLTVRGRALVLGATLNNSPTVQDLWNTTPAWGWPFVTSGPWPGMGSNAALVDGTLAQAVAGATVYAFLDETVYVEAGLYRSAPLGESRPFTQETVQLIDGAAPYWRVALQQQLGKHMVEIGTYGLYAALKPGGVSPPPGGYGVSDSYTDVAFDAQWQYESEVDASLRATWIHERRTLGASAPGEHPALNTLRVSGDVYRDWLGVGAGVFRTGSTRSANFGDSGSADTAGGMAELILRPFDNVSLRAQYTHYAKRDGVSSGASDADTFAMIAWIAF
jgi:hypothetical protein